MKQPGFSRSRAHVRGISLVSLLLIIALLGALAVAVCAGQFPLSPSHLLELVIAGPAGGSMADSAGSGSADAASALAHTILWKVRGPRVLACALVGAALAASGVALQAVFRNPLAAPDLLGVSAGSALGAMLGILFGWTLVGIQVAAFSGGLGAVVLVWIIGTRLVLRDQMLSLVLSGFAIGSLLGALGSLVKLLADPVTQLPAMTFWLLGSFASVGPRELFALAIPLFLALVPLYLLRWQANALALSDDEVRSIGIRLGFVRGALVLAATLATASSVALVGIIGWVGLVVPHLARLMVGMSVPRVLPVAMLAGALLMVVIDTLGRTLGSIEIAPGVLTALIGAPALFLLMARARNE